MGLEETEELVRAREWSEGARTRGRPCDYTDSRGDDLDGGPIVGAPYRDGR